MKQAIKQAFIPLALLLPVLLIAAVYQAVLITVQPLAQFPTQQIKLGDRQLKVAVAQEKQLRKQGLRRVEDLGELDGMLFVYPKPTRAEFIMKDTSIPLTVAFYSSRGEFIEQKDMEPCSENCPTYTAQRKLKYALEVPQRSKIKLNSKLSL